MADFNQFGSVKPGATGDPQHCARCEAMLTDALDGTLSSTDQATFDLHLVGCPACSEMLADAKRGLAWMEMLYSPRPEPPADLLERILAQTNPQTNPRTSPQTSVQTNAQTVTQGSQAARLSISGKDISEPSKPVRSSNTLLGRPMLVSLSGHRAASLAPHSVLPFRTRVTYGLRSFGQTMLQPRLAMTAAMAFFSIALTLNLTGVRVSQLRAGDLKPSSILRSCYEAKAKVVRYSDNLRVVYELESRVRDLQHSSDDDGQIGTPATSTDPATKPAPKPSGDQQQPDGQKPDQKQSSPRPNPGSSRREAPAGSIRQVRLSQPPPSLRAPAEVLVVSTRSRYKAEGSLV